MRTLIPAAAIAAGLVVLGGCGQPGAHGSGQDGPGGPGSAPALAAGAAGHAACRSPAAAVRTRDLVLTGGDTGRTYCVRGGTAVQVYLKGTPGRRWAPVQVSSGALRPRANGHLMLQLGVTGASFFAAGQGTAVLSSSRPPCAPGTAACQAPLAFRVTVVVQP